MASFEPPQKKAKVFHTPSFAQKSAFKLPANSVLRTPGSKVQNDYKLAFGKENLHSKPNAVATPLKTPSLPFSIPGNTPLRQLTATNGASPAPSTKKAAKSFAISAEQALTNPFINPTPKATPVPKTVLKPPTFQPSTPTPKPSTFAQLPPPISDLFQNRPGTPANLQDLTQPPTFTDLPRTHTDRIYDDPNLTKSENALQRELNRGLEISPKKRDTQQGWASGKRKFVRNGLAERISNYINSADTSFMFWRKEIQREPPAMQSTHTGGRSLAATLVALSKVPGRVPPASGSTTVNGAVYPLTTALASGSPSTPTPSKPFRLPAEDICVRIEEIVGMVPLHGHSMSSASSSDPSGSAGTHSVLTRCTLLSVDKASTPAATEAEGEEITHQLFVVFKSLPVKSSYTTLPLPPLDPLEPRIPNQGLDADRNLPSATDGAPLAQDDVPPSTEHPVKPKSDRMKPKLSSADMLDVGREVLIWKPFADIPGDSTRPFAGTLSSLGSNVPGCSPALQYCGVEQDRTSGLQTRHEEQRTIFCTRFLVAR